MKRKRGLKRLVKFSCYVVEKPLSVKSKAARGIDNPLLNRKIGDRS